MKIVLSKMSSGANRDHVQLAHHAKNFSLIECLQMTERFWQNDFPLRAVSSMSVDQSNTKGSSAHTAVLN